MEEGGGSNGRQRDFKVIEREGSDVMCNAGLPFRSGDGSIERETPTEAAGLRKELGQQDCRSEEGG